MKNDFLNLPMKEIHWDRFLNEIKDHRIVPVVGQELLHIEVDGEPIDLYAFVARQLIIELDIDESRLDSNPSISDVAFEFCRQQGDLEDVYHQVSKILHSRDWGIPNALRKLAEISHFDLFITTTPDDLMWQAVNEVRFSGRQATQSLAYSPETELSDLSDGYRPDPMNSPCVYQLFGSSQSMRNFVVTEDDTLRYVNRLQGEDYRPDNLFDAIRPRSLAWLGVSFPDWLIRFLYISAKGDALFDSYGVRGYVADRLTKQNNHLLKFLSRNKAKLYNSGDATAFVDELHEKWMKRFGNSNQNGQTSEPAINTFPKNGVFISYASEDRAIAQTIYEALENFGLKVWMDCHELGFGDDWKEMICRNIERCSIFVPLLSRNVETLERRYFRMEWAHALQEAEVRATHYPFIQPVLIDQVDPQSEFFPRQFRERHCARFDEGVVDSTFLQGAKQIIRDLSRMQRRGN